MGVPALRAAAFAASISRKGLGAGVRAERKGRRPPAMALCFCVLLSNFAVNAMSVCAGHASVVPLQEVNGAQMDGVNQMCSHARFAGE